MPSFIQVTINATGTFPMNKVNAGDFDATDGILYQYQATLGWGSHEFYVRCNDGASTTTSPTYHGPELNPFDGYSGTFLLISPVDGANVTNGLITFTWQSLGMATTTVFFKGQVSTSPSFVTITQEVTSIPETPTTTSTQVNLQITPGTYYWRVQPYYGAFSIAPSSPFTINIVDKKPVVSFTSNVTTTGTGDSVGFTFTGMDGDEPASFAWSFGDGTPNSTARNPVHAFATPGNYTVTLTVIDMDGDSNKSVATITVLSYPRMVQPSSSRVSFMQGSTGSFGLLLHDDTSGSGTFTMTIHGYPTSYTNVSWVNGVATTIIVGTTNAGDFLFTISITNANNLTRNVTITVSIDDYPVITIGSSDFTIDKEKGSVFLNWTVSDSYGAGSGSYVLFMDGTRVSNGSWISGERISVKVMLDMPAGVYNFSIRVYIGGSTAWYATDSVIMTVMQSQLDPMQFIKEYWYVIVAAVAGLAVAVGIAMAARKRGAEKKKAETLKVRSKQLPDTGPVQAPIVGKLPPGKSVDAAKAKATAPDSGQERKFSAQELQDIKATAEEVTTFKQAKTCIVHKGPITGTIYVCPQCDSLYCLKCATVLKEAGQKCWMCGTDLLKDEDQDNEARTETSPETSGTPGQQFSRFYCTTCSKYHDISDPNFETWYSCPTCSNLLKHVVACPACNSMISLTKEDHVKYKETGVRCSSCNTIVKY